MRTAKTWGYEELVHNGDYCMKLLVYTRTIASSLHYHERKHETFYVASGQFQLEINELPYGRVDRFHAVLMPGKTVVLPPNTVHRVRCIVPGVIVEASSHDDPNDCVRLEPSEQ